MKRLILSLLDLGPCGAAVWVALCAFGLFSCQSSPTPSDGEVAGNYWVGGVRKPKADPDPVPIDEQSPVPSPNPDNGEPSKELPEDPAPKPTCPSSLDFDAMRAKVEDKGKRFSHVKIGFHGDWGGESRKDLHRLWYCMDAAGVPIFYKNVGNTEELHMLAALRHRSGVPHTVIFRMAGGDWDIPRGAYSGDPEQVAREHWDKHLKELNNRFPVSKDVKFKTEGVEPFTVPAVPLRELIWIETINEPKKEASDWLGKFSSATADLAVAAGYKWAALGFSGGEPELSGPDGWEAAGMKDLLCKVADDPEHLAIAVHEYDLHDKHRPMWEKGDSSKPGFPWMIGRLYGLLDTTRHSCGGKVPRVMVTEFGWHYNWVPEPAPALAEIAWASKLYAQYPTIDGAAVWYLTRPQDWGGIGPLTEKLIQPLSEYSLTHYFECDPTCVPNFNDASATCCIEKSE